MDKGHSKSSDHCRGHPHIMPAEGRVPKMMPGGKINSRDYNVYVIIEDAGKGELD